MSQPNKSRCPLCDRLCHLTFHHLIPRKLHRRPRFRDRLGREERNRGIRICRKCHNGIHARYDERTLAARFHDIELIRNDPALARHFEWVSKQRER